MPQVAMSLPLITDPQMELYAPGFSLSCCGHQGSEPMNGRYFCVSVFVPSKSIRKEERIFKLFDLLESHRLKTNDLDTIIAQNLIYSPLRSYKHMCCKLCFFLSFYLKSKRPPWVGESKSDLSEQKLSLGCYICEYVCLYIKLQVSIFLR